MTAAADNIVFDTDADGAEIRNVKWRGTRVVGFDGVCQRLDRLDAEFQPRNDDVLLLAFVKCGTHWLNEVCHLLLSGNADVRPPMKVEFMMELHDYEHFEQFPSPRVLNCHLNYNLLPQQLRKCKIVLAVRNPKDAAVSFFHHCSRIALYNYSGNFSEFLPQFANGFMECGSYFEYYRSYLQAIRDSSLTDIHIVQYEQLKSDTRNEVLRLHRFLKGDTAAPLSDQLLDSICHKISFQQMQKDRGSDLKEVFKENDGTGFYRKGEVGDWRNWFSDEQSSWFDQLMHTHLAEFSDLYSPVYQI